MNIISEEIRCHQRLCEYAIKYVLTTKSSICRPDKQPLEKSGVEVKIEVKNGLKI